MAREDYNEHGWQGQRGREWPQGGRSRFQGQPRYEGGYGRASSGQAGYGSGRYSSEGAYGQPGYGQGGYGQGGFGPGAYGQPGFGQTGYSGAYGQGPYGQGRQSQGMQGGRGESGYGESGYGEGRVAWPEQRESYGRQREPRPGGSGQERQRGQFAGRGPKGYKRSDDRIREDVNEELTRNPDLDATDIEVKVESGEVTLSGTVDDRRAKRLAEELAERCSGVHEVHNQLRIDHAQSQSGSEREGGETMPRRS
jgi:osmotically-inducible protein OsmY